MSNTIAISRFVDTVSAALAYSVMTTRNGTTMDEWDGIADATDAVRKFCRRAAYQLLFDLDRGMLFDLACEKLDSEGDTQARFMLQSESR